LLELSQIYADRHWRAGPGSPAAESHLSQAVEVLTEAYGHLEPNDTLRAQVAAQLGWLLGARVIAYGGSDEERETAISRLDEGLAWTGLPPAMRATARISLGSLYMHRASRSLASGDAMMQAIRASTPPPSAAEATRAADCFRQVLAEKPVSAEITTMAETMLKVAEAMEAAMSGFGKGLGGYDMSRMVEAMTAMQRLQEQAQAARAGTEAGLPRMPSLFDAEELVAADPLDRPVVLVEGPEPVETYVPRPRHREAAPVALDDLRRQLRDAMAGATDPYQSAADLLRPGAPRPDIGVVDELVALATAVAHQAGEAATADDHLQLAVALHLRGGAGADDWADDASDGETGDAKAAMEHLLKGVDRLTAGDLDTAPVIVRLATILEGEHLAGRLLDRISDHMVEPARALRSAGVEVVARQCPDGVLVLDTGAARWRLADAAQPLSQRVVIVGEPLPDWDVTASYVSSARQAIEVAGRRPTEVTDKPVFVVDPGGRPDAVELVRQAFYPGSTLLGPPGADAAATPAEVRARLGASMLHVECGITESGALKLTGPEELTPAAIVSWDGGSLAGGASPARGGLAVLPPAAGGFVPLADALLAAGFTGVVGWLRPVPPPVAALMVFVLHAELVRGGLPPAMAVRTVRDWMRDKRRGTLDYLPEPHAVTVERRDLTDPRYWTALVHRGI
jgi:hypothetical protein